MVVIRESVNQGFLIHFLFGTMILVGLKGQVSVLFCVDSREEQNASSIILVIERLIMNSFLYLYVVPDVLIFPIFHSVDSWVVDISTLNVLFRQITLFFKVRVAFVFGCRTL